MFRYLSHPEVSLFLSGLQWRDIATCVKWMAAFVCVVREEGQTQVTAAVRQGTATSDVSTGSGLLKSMPHVVVDDSHNIQTHSVDLQMLVNSTSPFEQNLQRKVKHIMTCNIFLQVLQVMRYTIEQTCVELVCCVCIS